MAIVATSDITISNGTISNTRVIASYLIESGRLVAIFSSASLKIAKTAIRKVKTARSMIASDIDPE